MWLLLRGDTGSVGAMDSHGKTLSAQVVGD